MSIEDIPRLAFDEEKVSDTYGKIVEVFQEAGLTTGEILVTLSNLGYTLGASIAGYTGKGPSHADLQKLYATMSQDSGDPHEKMGIALMLQSMTVASWYEDYEQLVLDIKDTKEKKV